MQIDTDKKNRILICVYPYPSAVNLFFSDQSTKKRA